MAATIQTLVGVSGNVAEWYGMNTTSTGTHPETKTIAYFCGLNAFCFVLFPRSRRTTTTTTTHDESLTNCIFQGQSTFLGGIGHGTLGMGWWNPLILPLD